MSRSLRVAPDNIKRVKLALKRNGFPSQQTLANELGIARGTVNNFLNGKNVDFATFEAVCNRLGLDWGAIADKEHSSDSDIDALVKEAREKIERLILSKCSTVKVLKMPKPIKLERIYIDLNVLEEIPGRLPKRIDTLRENFNSDSRNLGHTRSGGLSEQLIPGIEAAEHYDKLIVWGKPGAGKTTFLKHLAIQCIKKQFQPNLVPIFISIEEFVKTPERPNLLVFIKQIFTRHKVTEDQITKLLNEGRVLILLDGFDEVKEKEDSHRVLADIRYLSSQFDKNRFVLACRIGGANYGFNGFTEVEIADFDKNQIAQFAHQWFQAIRENTKPASNKKTETPAKFLKQLKIDRSIEELATNPLLLTMLCLAFEENAEFPKKRFDLYKEAIDILLIKWDGERDIERPQVYQKLELRGKRDLLSHIAYKTFEQNEYFFEKEDLEQDIADFLRTLPDAKTDLKDLEEDSEKVLKAIESQHGLLVERARDIYSFSHLTFQEYFTAREIINSSDPQVTIKAWEKLVQHITESRWREVFILAVGALKSAKYALKLMKKQVDTIVAEDEGLQNFLTWVKDESLKVEISDNKTAIRAFYLDIDIDIDSERQLGYLIDFDCTCRLTYASFLAHALNECEITPEIVDLARKFDLSCVGDYALEPTIAITVVRVFAIDDLEREFGSRLGPEMKEKLQKLKEQMPNLNGDMESLLDWSKTHGKAWNKQVKDLIVDPHKFNCHYPNNEPQKEIMNHYYNANRLLLECMNIANMTPEVRKEIKDNLLLPVS